MIEPIRGKVAQVLSAQEIALNVGTAKGVTVGMAFDVMSAYENINDPDTGEVLGSIEHPKARVEITHAQEKLSVARTYRATQSHSDGSSELRIPAFGPVARALLPPSWVEKYEKPRRTKEAWDHLNEENGQVKTGDIVVQVIETHEAKQKDSHQK